jgi:hypothetical protein
LQEGYENLHLLLSLKKTEEVHAKIERLKQPITHLEEIIEAMHAYLEQISVTQAKVDVNFKFRGFVALLDTLTTYSI